jgi:hypothetical protein
VSVVRMEVLSKDEKSAGCAPRVTGLTEVEGCQRIIRISKHSGPQTPIGIRMEVHMV